MSPARYSVSAIALHWAIAMLLAVQLGLGWRMTGMPPGAAMFSAFQFHKSLGFLILALSLARVGVRLACARPAEVESGPTAKLLVKGVHFLLYVVMIGGPLTGWMVVSTAKIAVPTQLFGAIPVPHLPLGKGAHGAAELGHAVLAWIGAGLILLHVAGAIRHHLLRGGSDAADHEDVVGRMIPAVSQSRGNGVKVAAAAGAAALLIAGFGLPWRVFAERAAALAPPASAAASQAVPDTAEAAGLPDAGPSDAAPSDEPTAAETQTAEISTVPSGWMVDDGGVLGFTASMNGAAINGHFRQWSADVRFDPDALDSSSISVRIPLLSADTGESSRDEMLKGPNFFGPAGAAAVYRSRTIRHLQGNRYSASGTLTMNGKSRPLTLNFDLAINGEKARVSGGAQIDRLAFGIGSGEWESTDQIASKVDVNFVFSARRAK